MITDYEFTTTRSVDEVFAVIVAVDQYHEWLPPSETYLRTEWESDTPLKRGARYVDYRATVNVKSPLMASGGECRAAVNNSYS